MLQIILIYWFYFSWVIYFLSVDSFSCVTDSNLCTYHFTVYDYSMVVFPTDASGATYIPTILNPSGTVLVPYLFPQLTHSLTHSSVQSSDDPVWMVKNMLLGRSEGAKIFVTCHEWLPKTSDRRLGGECEIHVRNTLVHMKYMRWMSFMIQKGCECLTKVKWKRM